MNITITHFASCLMDAEDTSKKAETSETRRFSTDENLNTLLNSKEISELTYIDAEGEK